MTPDLLAPLAKAGRAIRLSAVAASLENDADAVVVFLGDKGVDGQYDAAIMGAVMGDSDAMRIVYDSEVLLDLMTLEAAEDMGMDPDEEDEEGRGPRLSADEMFSYNTERWCRYQAAHGGPILSARHCAVCDASIAYCGGDHDEDDMAKLEADIAEMSAA